MATTTTGTSRSSSSSHTTPDIASNLSNLLPTGTFLAFQAIAPLFTNNGNCGPVEKIMTGILVGTFSWITFVLTFTDSITTSGGKHYYGLVTWKGLFNPQFKVLCFAKGSCFYKGTSDRYILNVFDFINAVLDVVVFAALVLLTPPVSACYYPNLPSTLLKTIPILVGIVAALYFSFAPPPRRGVGYSVTGLVHEPADDSVPKVPDDTTTTTTSAATELIEGANSGHLRQSLLTRANDGSPPSPEQV